MSFKVSKKTLLGELDEGDILPDSDFAIHCPKTNQFVQFEYVSKEDEYQTTPVKPGIWAITKSQMGFELERTSFVQDRILEEFVHTKHISEKIDCFFQNVHVYKEEGFEVAKRAALLYGPPGTGKTTVLSKICNEYVADGKTAIIVWHTDKFEARHIKGFIKHFDYQGVDKIILVVEDIGGTEMEEVRHRSDSSLLSLLDNQEKTFTIPTLILATTNFPEALLGNLTNRPNRFDDKIEVAFPPPDARGALLKFFTKDTATDDEVELIKSKKCTDFTPAHIREIRIRSRIYKKSVKEVIDEMMKEIEHYKKSFQNKKAMGMGFDD